VIRPGADPLARLAQTLNQALGSRTGRIATLRSSPLGLLDTSRYGRTPIENLLIVVDQFEDIFRFQREYQGRADEAAQFVELLLAAVQECEAEYRVYVVITMRSDYFGECARFPGLPEALNESQYLVPRMTPDQLREVIEGPVALAGAEMAPELVQRLIDDLGDDFDQLPLLQHALMRTWAKWRRCPEPRGSVGIGDYESVGEIADALSRHADEIFQELEDDEARRIAKKLFQRLCGRADNRDVRCPTRLNDICLVAEADEARVIRVIDAFRSPGRTFLTPSISESLTSESVIDISHESLIRHWRKLSGWAEEEAKSAGMYQRL